MGVVAPGEKKIDTDAYSEASRISPSTSHPKLVRSQNHEDKMGKEFGICGREVKEIQEFNGNNAREGDFPYRLNRRPGSVRW